MELSKKEQARKLYDQGADLIHEYDFQGREPSKLERALSFFHNTLKIDPSYIDAYIGIANCKLKRNYRGDLGEATNMLKKAVELDANHPYAHLNLGRCLDLQGNLDSAVFEMERAISLKKDFHIAHYDVAKLYLKKQEYVKAKEHLEHAVKSEFDQIATNAKELLKLVKEVI